MRMHRGDGGAHSFARAETAVRAVTVAMMALCLGCNSDAGSSVEETAAPIEAAEPTEATKPSGSQECNVTGREMLWLALQQEGEFSRFLLAEDGIPLRVATDIESGGTLTLEAVVTSIDAPAVRTSSNYPVARGETEANVSLPLSIINPPRHGLAVSRQLRRVWISS